MLKNLVQIRLLRAAGLFTWFMVGMPLLYSWIRPFTGDAQGLQPMPLAGWFCYFVNGAAFYWLTRELNAARSWTDILLLLVLTASAIGVTYYNQSGLGSVLLMVSVSALPWLLPEAVAVFWVIASQLAIMPVFVRVFGFPLVEAAMQVLLYTGLSGFIFVTSWVARQQAQAREEQRQLNAELRATRALLAESARVNERTRIARELHDLLGHHLTALSLNLEVAGHLAQGKAQEHVSQAHTLARLLLSDVREAVSNLREGETIDMASSIRPLTDNVPGLEIALAMPQPFLLDDAERAHVLLRCTQELITNTVRHAQARRLRLQYVVDADGLTLHAHDDGRGAEAVRAGNGLNGMRERLQALGGSLAIRTAPGEGFHATLRLPLAGKPAVTHEMIGPAGTVEELSA